MNKEVRERQRAYPNIPPHQQQKRCVRTPENGTKIE